MNKGHIMFSLFSGLQRLLIAGAMSLPLAFQALADGTETLGPPSIPIASGTGVIAAGVGLATQPGDISFSVPAGATVKQVLLYWEGQDFGTFTGDADIIVNGNLVNENLVDEAGRHIDLDCTLCHSLLAQRSPRPFHFLMPLPDDDPDHHVQSYLREEFLRSIP